MIMLLNSLDSMRTQTEVFKVIIIDNEKSHVNIIMLIMVNALHFIAKT